MAFNVGELVGSISLNDQFSGPINNVAKTLGMTSESFKAVTGFAALAGGAVVGATAAIVALGQRGADVADVRGAFDQLSTAAGSSADVMLGALREGTLGTISDFDLMQKATGVLGSGMVRTADEMKTLAAGAQMLADRTGGDTATAFETLTGAMASGRMASLKQLGLFVDTDAAVKKYAASIGKLPKDLSDTEVAQAKAAGTLAALHGQLVAAGPSAADFGDHMKRGQTLVQNFTDGLGEAIAKSPVVAAGMNVMQTALQSAFGGPQTDLIKTLMGFVNDFAIRLVNVAQGAVTGAGLFISAWHGIQTVVLGVITAVSGVATAIVAYVDGIVQLSSKIPGLSDMTEGLRAGSAALATDMVAVTRSLADQTVEAAKGVLGNSALHRSLDVVSNTLAGMESQMTAAGNATAVLTEKVKLVPSPLANVGTAAVLATTSMSEMLDAVAEQFNRMMETATAASDIQTQVQNAISLANTTGIAQRQMELDIDKQAQLAKLQELLVGYPLIYAEIAAQVSEKFKIMSAAAAGYHTDIAVQAGMVGFQTRAALEATAANAIDTYERMKQSGIFTAEEVRKAWQKAEEAKRALTGATTLSTVQQFDLIANSASSILRSVFGKNKLAAIAAVGIDTAAAIVKTFAQFGFPWGLVPAAAMAATAAVQMNKIRTADAGFAQGVPEGQFIDFGRVSTIDVHGPETIMTPKQGMSVAGMVEDELKLREDRVVAQLQSMEAAQEQRDKRLPYMIQSAILLARA